ncbi:hypothetical protein [Sporomusa acidovorans]|uniref:hypothetical protein n=1 Tax=Sporomusa acidovorans TaxID=112900 RepID=UPI001160733A|nr:hypothetical protein [Sporomusa acidovorans]
MANLHAVATSGSYLYATGYDLAKIALVDMSNSYSQTASYDFLSSLAVTGASYHGEGLAVYNGYLYALYTCNPSGGYSTYDDSYVVQYEIDEDDGILTYKSYVRVGKNAFTLELYENKLYICALGGMQNGGNYNTATCLSIVTIGSNNSMTAANVSLATGMSGDFRDISIANGSNAYILLGYYDSSYAKLVGKIYHSTVANLASPATGQKR